MCRLMGYVSGSATTFSVIGGKNFPQFSALSALHNDGWGIAIVGEEEVTSVILEPTPAVDSPKFLESSTTLQADAALLHFRWATTGLAVSEENTHPFSYQQYSFIHNGGISPKESVDPFVDGDLFSQRRGDTDSERYFLALVSHIRKVGLIEGTLEGVREIRNSCNFSSLNAMLLTPKYYLVICEHNNTKIPGAFENDLDYFELNYRQDERGIVVASSGWDQSDWATLANHRLLVVNRITLEVEILEI